MTGTVKTIDQALDMAGFSHYNLYLFLFFGWVTLSMTFEIFGTFYIIDPMIAELGVTDSQLTVINQMILIGLFISANKWGYAVDTKGRQKILKVALFSAFGFGACAAFSPHWIVFGILKCISSISVTGIFVSSFPLLIECTPLKRRKTVVILSISTFLIAFGTMSVLSFPILSLKFSGYIPVLGIYFNSWRLMCLLFTLPNLVAALAVKHILESPKFFLFNGKEEEALEVLRRIYTINHKRSADNFKVQTLELNEDNLTTQNMNIFKAYIARLMGTFKKPRSRYFPLIVNSQMSGYVCAYCYIELLPVIANAFLKTKVNGVNGLTVCEMIRTYQNATALEVNHDTLVSGFSMAMVFAVGIGLAVFNVIINGLTNYVNRKKIIFLIQIVVAIAALCINYSPYIVLTGILFVLMLSGIVNIGLLFTYVDDVFLSSTLSMAVGLVGVAGLGGPQLFTGFIKKFVKSHCEVVFTFVLGASLLSMIFIFFLPSDESMAKSKITVTKTEEELEENET